MKSYCKKNPSLKDWMIKKFTPDELRDMVNHGIKMGFSGLIYYSETTVLYKKHHEEIWEMLTEDAEAMGYRNALALIATFSGAEAVDDNMTLVNLLVWYACERIAQVLTEEG
jgi:hypothetical protein